MSMDSISSLSSPVFYGVIIFLVSLLPFIALSCSAFIKVHVVLSMLKNALGAQQVPSSLVTTFLACTLTLSIMQPVITKMYETMIEGYQEIEKTQIKKTKKLELTPSQIFTLVSVSAEPLKEFLQLHSNPREKEFFSSLGAKKDKSEVSSESLFQLLPAFVVSELKEGFVMGVTVFIPFLLVDLVVSTVLVALGMMMVNPISIALPCKVLLFVLCDGWVLLCQGIISGYR